MAAIRWLCHFGIPSLVPLEESLTYAEIAKKGQVPESQLRRVSRLAMTSGVFYELDDSLAHTPLSAELRQGAFLDAMMMLATFVAPISAKLTEMTEKFGASEASNETAFNIAMDTEVHMYKFIQQNPKVGARFVGAMKLLGESGEVSMQHVITGFDWASLGEAKIIDVS